MARATVALLVLACFLTFTGCGREIAGAPVAADGDIPNRAGAADDTTSPPRPVPPLVPPATVRGGAGTHVDRLAADVVAGVEQYWRETFPAQFGRRWVNIRAFVASDPADAANPPPCLRHSLDLSNQALYCPRLDTVAWDRSGLLPRLHDSYGSAAVVVALAHEIGHAVQDRLGIDAAAQLRQPDRYPTILLEGMADCFAGAVLHAVSDGRVPKLSVGPRERDRALRALLTFRDPVGAPAGRGAHGNAFDRASAFVDGYQGGPGECAGMTARNQLFTQRGFTSLADAARAGNLPLSELLDTMGRDARGWFGELASTHGHPWQPPALSLALPIRQCGPASTDAQGPVRFCPQNATVVASMHQLASVHDGLGDYASATVIASRYALAALATLGRPVQGAEAGRTAVCLTGAYTRALFDRGSGFGLSPGDLDEAVDELLTQDFAARDALGKAPSGDLGFERIRQFRAGALGGPAECGL